MPSSSDRIEVLLNALTLEEKCHLVAGKNMWETMNVDRLGICSLKTTDGPAGVRGATWIDGTHTTYIPCGISLAATFDPDLIERVGGILGMETKSKNSHVLLAPTMNISRSPLGGRNFENFGEDPYLSGRMATSYIRGVQKHGVGACMKHYVANDMETRRFNMDQEINERTLREIYLRPFEMALEAQPWTAMSSYPKINGEHADSSKFLIDDVLRKEWGFDNLVMSDWGGLNDTIKSMIAGTDLEMPGPPIRYGKSLIEAVKAGRASEQDNVNASVRRLLQLLDRAGLLDKKHERSLDKNSERSSDLPEFRQLTRKAASEAIVLLKNDNNLLPLQPQQIKRLAILGPNARKPTTGGTGSAAVNPYYITNAFESISTVAKEMNPDMEVLSSPGIFTNLQPPLLGDLIRTPDGAKTGIQVSFFAGHNFEGPVMGTTHWQNTVIFMMSDGDTPNVLRGKPHCYRLSGIITPTETGAYDFSLSNTGKSKLYIDDELLIDNSEWSQTGGTFMNCGSVNQFAEITLEKDRQYKFRVDNIVVRPPIPAHDNTLFHTLSGLRVGMQRQTDEQALFDEAISMAKDADVVILVVGHNNDTEKEGIDRTSLYLPRRTNEFVDAVCKANSNTVVVTQSASAIAMPWLDVTRSIVHAWYQGQENGNALADVIVGRVNPSGKLPITFPRQLEDHGSFSWFPGDVERDQAKYGEGILVGYRWFDTKDIQPLWPFGYGLSYTTFTISNISVHGTIVVGDASSVATVSTTVTNTGDMDGAEVLQLYISSSPAIAEKGLDTVERSLVGFSKVTVPVGQSKTVQMAVARNAIRWFDMGGESLGGKWRFDKGEYICSVGTSSRNFVGKVTITVE